MDFYTHSSIRWDGVQSIENQSFICGYCGDKISSDRGYKLLQSYHGTTTQVGGVYICSNCHGPNFLTAGKEWLPGQPFGRAVNNVPEPLNELYEEARRCAKNSCYTAAVLLCRKMLMNVAVSQGAKENLKFIEYVNFLSEKGYVPPNGRKWIDHIRKKGNEATHEIHMMGTTDAKELIFFSEMLLIFLYEFPSMIPDETDL